MNRTRFGSVAAAFVCVIGMAAAQVSAQDVLMSATNSVAWDFFGESVAWGPDLDGDGFREVAVGAPNVSNIVCILSGRDFSRMHTIAGVSGTWFGISLCWCGDQDGDGLSDLAISAPGHGPVLPKVYVALKKKNNRQG